MNWGDLKYWDSGEWSVVQELLADLDVAKIKFNPAHENLFAALEATPFDKVKCVIMGQDPYPKRAYATGVAFSIPKDVKEYPDSLVNIFSEYSRDLHYPDPPHGNLTKWCEEGVLLWNVYPTCLVGKPNSHHWSEWELLTEQMIKELDKGDVLFVFLGGAAGMQAKHVVNNECFFTSHPSPRGAYKGPCPFIGSRLFSTINTKLCAMGLTPIDWRL